MSQRRLCDRQQRPARANILLVTASEASGKNNNNYNRNSSNDNSNNDSSNHTRNDNSNGLLPGLQALDEFKAFHNEDVLPDEEAPC